MNESMELLNYVYQNAQMGIESIEQLLDLVQPGDFREKLEAQCKGYHGFLNEAKKLLTRSGQDEKGLSALEKVRTDLMINLQTLTDRTTPHLAEMILLGSNMGIVDAIKKQRQYRGAEPEFLDLMKRLQQFEEKNVETMKLYL